MIKYASLAAQALLLATLLADAQPADTAAGNRVELGRLANGGENVAGTPGQDYASCRQHQRV